MSGIWQGQYRGTSNSFLCGFLLGLLLVIGKSSSCLFSKHLYKWDLISLGIYVCVAGFPPNAKVVALAKAYKPQSYPFVCSATLVKVTFSLFACIATKLATRTSSSCGRSLYAKS